MIESLIEIFRQTHDSMYVAMFVVAVFLLISGLDDVFLDLYYWFHYLSARKQFSKYRHASPEKLAEIPEKPIAIFIPAWHEANVIDKMLLNACRTIQYKKYDIFVGAYINDPETIARVE